MKAVIMAGGEGTRLRPLTSNQPKPMMPLANRPMMEHIVDAAAAARLRRDRRHRRLHGRTPSAPTSATAPSSACGWSTPPRRRRSAPPARSATPWTSSTSASSSSPATCSPTSTSRKVVAFHEERSALATIGLVARREPARVRHRHHPGGRLHRALPGEADLGPGVQRHHQHRHLRARTRDLRLHRGRHARSTSPARSSPPCSRTGKPLYGAVAEGYWEDVGTLDAYVRAHKDVLDGKVEVDIPGFRLSRGRVARRGGRDPPRRRGRGSGGHRRQLPGRGRRPARRVHRARRQRPGPRRRRPRAGRRARQRLPRPGRPPPRRRHRPVLRPAQRRALRGGGRPRRRVLHRRERRPRRRREGLSVQDRRGRARSSTPRSCGRAEGARSLFGRDGVAGLANVDITPRAGDQAGHGLRHDAREGRRRS